ncbi:MAG TPA: hypothetical protein VN947_00540 [Polyangia bacterium]|nr:hypothetical protein [Polyangia bacterium]
MKRRAFLATIGASTAAAALWPSLIRRAFADASFDAPGAKKTAPGLSTNAKHIDPSKRPQLVIVIPADDGQKYRRGEMWGEYLNHGEPSQLAPLAHVDVSCATMAELGALAKDVKGEPLAILFSQGGGVRVLDATLPEYNVGRRFDPKNDDAIVDKRIAVMSKMVAGALPPVPSGEVRAAAARVIRAVRETPPAGSHWANASGCGPATVENMKEDDGEVVGYGCGMGHVPAKSSRFLYFFAKTPQQMERDAMREQEAKAKALKSKKAER